MTEILSIEQVEATAAQRGIAFDAADYEIVRQAMDARRAQIESMESGQESQDAARPWVDRFNRWYPRFLRTLIGVGDVAVSGIQTVLIAFGVPVVLLMLIAVEQQRVSFGLSLFETHDALVQFGAWALVALNVLLELLISYLEHRANWIEPTRYDFSFALVWRRLAYMAGRGEWQPSPKSPAFRFRIVLRLITFSILALALGGSMRPALEQASGVWAEALAAILTQSTLIEMVAWIGGLLFALSAVLGAQLLTRYVATKVIEVIAAMSGAGQEKTRAVLEAVGASGAAALLARMKEKQTARRLAAAAPLSVAAEIAEPVSVVSETAGTASRADASPSASGVSETRITPAVARAMAWLREHPEHGALSLRDQAALAGLSAATMQRARKARPTQ